MLAAAMLLAISGCGDDTADRTRGATPERPAAAAPARPVDGTILAVGDSLTAGYGVSEDQAYPARLERRLHEAGLQYQVINAGISGETSTGTRNRIDWVMTLSPDIVILVTGGNDGLRGIDPALTRENLLWMVKELESRGVVVVLGGMQMFQNLGPAFTDAFEGAYRDAAAAASGTLFIPFFLEGVAGEPAYNQADGIHPTAAGYGVLVDHIFPYVSRAVDRHRQSR
jgi:acyl-CoA thioesterase-1